MIQDIDKKRCCGCTACMSICPKREISMYPDSEGFLYPRVDKENCVDCGICDKACPVENAPSAGDWERRSFVVRTRSRDVLLNSTSGGFVTPLAEWITGQNGAVCAAAYDDNFQVLHRVFKRGDSLLPIKGSRYVQSALNGCLSEVRGYLEQGGLVCFIGTTCQVAALKSFLGREYENLITVDLVCHGVPSPKLWNVYLNYQKNKYRSEISGISFRNKTYGYHSGTMKIQFSNGKTYYGSARVDYMLKSFLSEISSRPVCYECPFKTLERCSDFTIYDCWHASQLVEGLRDDDKGYTNVIVQSEKGMRVLEQIKGSYEIYPADTRRAVALDGVMILNAATPHPGRPEYYKGLEEGLLPAHIRKHIPVSRRDYLIERTKGFLFKTGLIRAARKIKSR